MVHIGPGAFFRAHTAWYTGRSGEDWGIAALTARSDYMVPVLRAQDGLYTVVQRGTEVDEAEVISSISEIVAHSDPRRASLLAEPAVSVVTLTVTEAGYATDSPLLSRLVSDLDARRRRDSGPVALVSCDNLQRNGSVLRQRLVDLAERCDAISGTGGLAAWIEGSCAFPATVVDRITPAARGDDLATASRLIGLDDQAAVVTEPWSEWIIEDAFTGTARPPWETVGAQLVDDVAPWERRKLLLLNAGHSLLAYLGGMRGHRFVHEALVDPFVHDALMQLWAEARPGIGVDSAEAFAYCSAVEVRWANHRLPHELVQIAMSGSLKLRQRVVPTVRAVQARGAEPLACIRVLGAWLAHLRGGGAVSAQDSCAVAEAAAGDLRAASRRVLGLLDEQLAEDSWLCRAVADMARSWEMGETQ
jgi:fructuronate reductase